MLCIILWFKCSESKKKKKSVTNLGKKMTRFINIYFEYSKLSADAVCKCLERAAFCEPVPELTWIR
jgi:hypothetical protein